MGDESLGRESNINFIYMRELSLVGMDSGSVCSVSCSAWSPLQPYLRTLLYHPVPSCCTNPVHLGMGGHKYISKMKSRELTMTWLAAAHCVLSTQPGGVILFTAT